MSAPAPRSETDDVQIIIVIIRTGGVAGIRRQWQVEPPRDEAPHWVTLIEQCPWDAPVEADRSADRYVWSISAHTPADRRERDLPDSAISGPWRNLVDAVREASRKDGGPAGITE